MSSSSVSSLAQILASQAQLIVLGVADETGTLKEGEVFCQYQENDDSQPTIVKSEVLVCRAPARKPSCSLKGLSHELMRQSILVSGSLITQIVHGVADRHVGDVRRAFAVDRPELRHLKNVIVFSTQGARDLPNM